MGELLTAEAPLAENGDMGELLATETALRPDHKHSHLSSAILRRNAKCKVKGRKMTHPLVRVIQMSPPTLVKVEPEEFKRVVQTLTGTPSFSSSIPCFSIYSSPSSSPSSSSASLPFSPLPVAKLEFSPPASTSTLPSLASSPSVDYEGAMSTAAHRVISPSSSVPDLTSLHRSRADQYVEHDGICVENFLDRKDSQGCNINIDEVPREGVGSWQGHSSNEADHQIDYHAAVAHSACSVPAVSASIARSPLVSTWFDDLDIILTPLEAQSVTQQPDNASTEKTHDQLCELDAAETFGRWNVVRIEDFLEDIDETLPQTVRFAVGNFNHSAISTNWDCYSELITS
ncbi:hypothetical protein KP509_26G054500 [Ceratopteris richardii]|uniref:VQ domain-containing protein n=1 Tax=Ceratopteris richardii TaxID=49495 RepID=A0A8T2RNN8_CERRI|nr:hypothetical protein KP509_26G054500 [Ceratopteris richardii]